MYAKMWNGIWPATVIVCIIVLPLNHYIGLSPWWVFELLMEAGRDLYVNVSGWAGRNQVPKLERSLSQAAVMNGDRFSLWDSFQSIFSPVLELLYKHKLSMQVPEAIGKQLGTVLLIFMARQQGLQPSPRASLSAGAMPRQCLPCARTPPTFRFWPFVATLDLVLSCFIKIYKVSQLK